MDHRPHIVVVEDEATQRQLLCDYLDKQNFRAATTLNKAQKLDVIQGGATLGSWPIEIIPDNPPSAAFVQPPRATIRAALPSTSSKVLSDC